MPEVFLLLPVRLFIAFVRIPYKQNTSESLDIQGYSESPLDLEPNTRSTQIGLRSLDSHAGYINVSFFLAQ